MRHLAMCKSARSWKQIAEDAEAERDRLREGLQLLIDHTPGSHPYFDKALKALLGTDD